MRLTTRSPCTTSPSRKLVEAVDDVGAADLEVYRDGGTCTFKVDPHFVSVIDQVLGISAKTVDTGKSPYGVAFDLQGRFALDGCSGPGYRKLEVFDGRTFDKIGEGGGPEARLLALQAPPRNAHLLEIALACGKSNEVLLTIDVASLQATHRLEGLRHAVGGW
jgi:hypothetical protein